MRLVDRNFDKSPEGEKPFIKTPVSVIDCNASTMSMASGGEYLKRDHKHLDKNAVKQTHDSIVPPTDIFEADRMVRGLGAYIMEQREAMQADSNVVDSVAPSVSVEKDPSLPME